MDLSGKDKFEMENSEEQLNYQASSMVDSFCPSLWNQSSNVGIGKPVPMLPPSLSHFPADSAFIERAARFSSFNGGSYMHPFGGTSESVSPYTSNGSPQDGSMPTGISNIEGGKDQRDKGSLCSLGESGEPLFNGIVQEETPNLGSGSGDSSSRDVGPRRRKRTTQEMEVEPVEGTPQSSTEGARDNANGKKKAERNNLSMTTVRITGKQPKESSEEPKEDYIHVRARRGQATNSHSLAERVRREKISERMKYLQDLVPGCSKVTGKAVMLDEIINYVQSLQRQVEFLSMKLATVNPRLDFNVEGLLSKDLLHGRDGSSSTMSFAHDMMHPQSHLVQQGMIPPGMPGMAYPSDALRRALSAQLTMMGGYKEVTPQMPNSWDAEIHNVLQMNYSNTNSLLNSQELSDTPRDGFLQLSPSHCPSSRQ